MQKIKIELSPHDAMLLASFHAEFAGDLVGDNRFISLNVAINNYFEQVVKNMDDTKLDDAMAEIEVNILLGRSPERP
ncbi:MAG TPA: hypothetical protein VGN20_19200 [Mucilaginibacter sp.]|jgi:hypothetical protein